ncbi:hypothetical protein E4U32_002226 [Claviceps aff. humidiphila group G2b]|nr:hypothetical protein E4U32_002226 [Claviceps aff. humidiphila group G2b]
MLDTMLIFGCALSLPNRLSLWRPVVLSALKIARAMRQGCSALLVWPPAPVPRMMAVQSILNEIMRGGDEDEGNRDRQDLEFRLGRTAHGTLKFAWMEALASESGESQARILRRIRMRIVVVYFHLMEPKCFSELRVHTFNIGTTVNQKLAFSTSCEVEVN